LAVCRTGWPGRRSRLLPASGHGADRCGRALTRPCRGWLVALVGALALLAVPRARADYAVESPDAIDPGYLVIEQNADAVFDRRRAFNGEQGYNISLGTGLTDWWHMVIELGYDHAPGNGEPTRLTQAVADSTFELTDPGEFFVDAGIYAEYGQTILHRSVPGANEVTFGPVISKDVGATTHTVNLFFSRLLGPDQVSRGMDFNYAWQSRWNVWDKLSPAVEIYGDAGTLGRLPPLSRQELLAGPVALGTVEFGELGYGLAGRMRYEVGWLFGATPATAAGTLRLHLELEVQF